MFLVRAIKGFVFLVGLAVVAYGVFFVPLGERTLYQHLRRVAATPEAQDLGREASEAGERLGEHVTGRWERVHDGGSDARAPDAR